MLGGCRRSGSGNSGLMRATERRFTSLLRHFKELLSLKMAKKWLKKGLERLNSKGLVTSACFRKLVAKASDTLRTVGTRPPQPISKTVTLVILLRETLDCLQTSSTTSFQR